MSTSFIKYYPTYNKKLLSDSPHIFFIKINRMNPTAEEISAGQSLLWY